METISVLLDITKFTDFRWRGSLGVCHVINIFFGSNCAKVHHCRICVRDFRERGRELFGPSHPWAALEMPILNTVKVDLSNHATNVDSKNATGIDISKLE